MVDVNPIPSEIDRETAARINGDKEEKLPIPGKRNVLITSALPYVNNVPHLGNIIGSVWSADVFARYCRLRGYNAIYSTATETKAMEEKCTPKEICDKYHLSFDEVERISTLGLEHMELCRKIMENNRFSENTKQQLYCDTCKRFLADRLVEGTCPTAGCYYEFARGDRCEKCRNHVNPTDLKDPKCRVCLTTPLICDTNPLFVAHSALNNVRAEYLYKTKDIGAWCQNADQVINDRLEEELKSMCITRDLKWGVPVPHENFKNMVMYPSTRIGTYENWTLMKTTSSVEHLNNEDAKFFESKAVGVFKKDAEDTIASEAVRKYYTQTKRLEGVLMVGAGADGVARHLSYKEHTWKRNGALSKAEDQGVYPICWVISVTEVLEAVHLIEHKELVQLSKQQLLDGCASKTLAYDSPLHCLFDWIKRNGLVSTSKYPWTGKKASLKKIEPEFTLEGYEIVSICDEDDIKRRLYERPLCIVILVSVQLKTLEKGKIYHVTKQEYDPYVASCKRLGRPIMYHSVLLTGWNEIGGFSVWEALNSYGDKYCDDGYFYFMRGSAINEDLEYNPLLQVLDVKGFKKAAK